MRNPLFSIAISAKRRPGQENNLNLSYPELLGTVGTGCIQKPDNPEMTCPTQKSNSFYGSNSLYRKNKVSAAGGSMFGLIYERDDQDNDCDRSGKLLSSPGATLQSRWFVESSNGYKDHFDKFARICAPSPPGKRPPAKISRKPPLIDSTPVAFPKSPRPDGVAPAAERAKFAEKRRQAKARSKSRPSSAAVGQYPWSSTRPTKKGENTVANLQMWQKPAPRQRPAVNRERPVVNKPDVMVINHN